MTELVNSHHKLQNGLCVWGGRGETQELFFFSAVHNRQFRDFVKSSRFMFWDSRVRLLGARKGSGQSNIALSHQTL